MITENTPSLVLMIDTFLNKKVKKYSVSENSAYQVKWNTLKTKI